MTSQPSNDDPTPGGVEPAASTEIEVRTPPGAVAREMHAPESPGRSICSSMEDPELSTETATTSVAESPADEETEEEARDVIVTEALGPRLSTRGVIGVAGAVLAFGLLAAGVGNITGPSARTIDIPGVDTPHVAAVENNEDLASLAETVVFNIKSETQSGASFLVTDTLLATNSHVVSSDVGTAVRVTSNLGEEFEGEVVMRDRALDLALVEIPEQDAEPVSFVGSKNQRAGQPVMIAGYPIGLELSIASGSASAIDQVTTLREAHAQAGLLQIDAPVNPGDSGGPVFSSDGRVMGMTTLRPDESGNRAVQGISFAIPSNDISIALNQYREYGDVKYGYLGVSMKGTSVEGALVQSVTSRSPADQVGLEKGDVITSVGGFETNSYVEVSRHLHTFRPGQTVVLTVERDGSTKEISVTLGNNTGS